MKILVINPYYSPYENPRAYRWTNICEEWIKTKHTVHVLTTKVHQHEDIEEINGVKIFRTGRPHPSLSKPSHHTSSNKLSTSLVGRLGKYFMKLWMWPDESMFWKSPALSEAKSLMNQYNYDHIVTVSLPFTSHLIGLELINEFQFIWSVDIGDPFNHHDILPRNNSLFYGAKNEKAEAEVLNTCDHIFVTNKSLQLVYENDYNSIKDKITAIPPLLTKSSKNITHNPNNPIITIGYFGSFYKNVREANGLNDFISALKKININWKVSLFGNIKKEFIDQIESVHGKESIEFNSHIKRDIVIHTMRQMDVLINIGNKSVYQLPSKVVDYLVSGVPIINIKAVEKDLFEEFTKGFNHILNLNEVDILDTLLIKRFLEQSGQLRLSSDEVLRLQNKYSGEKVAEEYLHQMHQRLS